ncbi:MULTISPECIES: RDD family protein [Citricoccus]|uniref:RDD family protein n=1 Tax=Citricoccus TaxID=169133 RepID=UPI000255ED77|nr:RDD family protein [Citricoccus sp. CH26A]
MQRTLNLVNAPAGKRLAAWLIDQIIPAVAVGVVYAVTVPAVLTGAGSARQDALVTLWLGMLIAGVLSLAYAVWLWGWQASAGKTPGHLLLGLRITSEEGTPAGWGPIFLRSVLIGVSGLVPVVGPVLMLLSNTWDTNHQRQGWHDKVARTLVLDVHTGRNPLTTGGLFGPSTFAPGALSPGDPGHPETGMTAPALTRWPAFTAAAAGPITTVPGDGRSPSPDASGPSSPDNRPAPPSTATPPAPTSAPEPGTVRPEPAHAATVRPTAAPTAAPRTPVPAGSGHSSGYREDRVILVGGAGSAADPDEELGSTQLRSRPAGPAAVRLRFDDGQDHELSGSALVGRNPSAAAGETVDLLIPFADMGRSVSKTHLHLTVDSAGVWVTDRNSTNGSGITPRGGQRRRLEPGQPVLAPVGTTVHFGDRSFTVSAA